MHCELKAEMNFETRELVLEMVGIDPDTGWLPEDIMLGILYPNDETGRGDGHISYIVKPYPDLPSGTQIKNAARIYFDWNDPIDTPMVLNTIDAGAPLSSVTIAEAVPSSYDLQVSWSGLDDPNGAGIDNYDIYVSIDDSSYLPWLKKTTATSALYPAQPGHTYAFYSIAHDYTGNTETAPARLSLPLILSCGFKP